MNIEKKDFTYMEVTCNERKIQDTILLAQTWIKQDTSLQRPSMGVFIAHQLKFISLSTWILQALILCSMLLFITLLSLTNDYEYAKVMRLCAMFPALLSALSMYEISKSAIFSMSELETSTYYSLSHIMIARFLILGCCDLFILSCTIALTTTYLSSSILDVLLYILVPFNICCGCSLTLLKLSKSSSTVYSCILFPMIFGVCNTLFQITLPMYSVFQINLWVFLFIISSLYLILELYLCIYDCHKKDCFLCINGGFEQWN